LSYDRGLISKEFGDLSLNNLQDFFHLLSRCRLLCGRNAQHDHIEEHPELVGRQAKIDHQDLSFC
jgi:hypothetical protein